MSPEWTTNRLSQIETSWSKIARAAGGSDESRQEARAWLLERYRKPIRQYLLALLRGNEDVADELLQEFAVRMMKGVYVEKVKPTGRFRKYLKRCLVNLKNDYYRAAGKAPGPLPPNHQQAAEDQFDVSWRRALVQRCYRRMEELETESGEPLFTALEFRKDHPGNNYSEPLAAVLTAKLGETVSAATARKKVQKARELFRDLLRRAVAETLRDPTPDNIAAELAELGLESYFREATGGQEEA